MRRRSVGKKGVGMKDSASDIKSQSTHEKQPKPSYTLEFLLAASDLSTPQTLEEREWVDAPAVGGELL